MFHRLDSIRYLAQFGFVLFNVKTSDTAHRQSQQLIHIRLGDIPQQTVAKRSQARHHFPVLRLLAAALLNPFVNAVFKKELCQGLGMAQFILPLQFNFQLPLQVELQPVHIAPQDLADAHLYRAAITDHHHFRRDRHRAIRVHVQPAPSFLRIIAAGRSNPYFHMVGGEIRDTGYADPILVRRPLYRRHQRLRGAGRRDLPDDQIATFNIDPGAQDDFAVAVVILSDIHQSSLLEVGIQLEFPAPQRGNLRIDEFIEVMRQYRRGHADRNAVAAEHKQTRQLRRKHRRFHFTPVVIGNKFSDVAVEKRLIGELGQPALGITSRRRRTARKYVPEVSLLVDVIGGADVFDPLSAAVRVNGFLFDATALVRQDYQRIADRSVPVRMEMHRIAYYIRHLLGTAVIDKVKRPQDPALHRLKPVIHIRNRPRTDDIIGVVKEIPVHHLPEVIVGAAPAFSDRPGFLLGRRRRERGAGAGEFFPITHNRRPPGCALYTPCARRYCRPCRT